MWVGSLKVFVGEIDEGLVVGLNVLSSELLFGLQH